VSRLLNAVRIDADIESSPAHLRPFASQLGYQARALGLKPVERMSAVSGPGWSYQVISPGGVPVVNHIQTWPDSDQPVAGELDVQARSGLLAVHGRGRGETRPLGLPYVSTLSACLSLQAALAAGVGQRRGLCLTHTRTSLGGSALVAMMQYLSESHDPHVAAAEVNPDYQPPFVSSDGVCFELETLNPNNWLAFWQAFGFSGALVARGWRGFMQRYARAFTELPSELIASLGEKSWEQISSVAQQTGMALCPVRSLAERRRDPDSFMLKARGPWRFTESLAPERSGPFRVSGNLPLSGVRVLESCRRIQGPLAGRLLQWLGAEVIRIEPPGGDPLRAMPPLLNDCSIRFQALNGDKETVEVDIKSSQGQAQLRELVRDSDVFLHNWAPGKARQLGLEARDLQRVNPNLLYFYAGGWEEGEEPDLPGTDFMVQAYSGVAAEVSRLGGGRGGSLFTLLDVLGGALASQGVCAGLLQSYLKPSALRGYSSLLGAASLLTRELPTASDSAVPARVAEHSSEPCEDPLLASGIRPGEFCQVTSPWRFA